MYLVGGEGGSWSGGARLKALPSNMCICVRTSSMDGWELSVEESEPRTSRSISVSTGLGLLRDCRLHERGPLLLSGQWLLDPVVPGVAVTVAVAAGLGQRELSVAFPPGLLPQLVPVVLDVRLLLQPCVTHLPIEDHRVLAVGGGGGVGVGGLSSHWFDGDETQGAGMVFIGSSCWCSASRSRCSTPSRPPRLATACTDGGLLLPVPSWWTFLSSDIDRGASRTGSPTSTSVSLVTETASSPVRPMCFLA
ncbi:hypothetical protein F7725_022425 [Dissostichus mawsoni]|uniref:Uncharacterized protein n=1 Tax=Dissostichus mawsoni TaxID=36200 RepID=A0A7J5YY36_DISMA|nr:hypothetical protein F7725_022425 [Dissostichus mawsoni]